MDKKFSQKQLEAMVEVARKPTHLGSAAEAYAARRTLVESMLDGIRQQVAVHSEAQAAGSGNWGFVGDLGYIAERLADVLESLPGLEEGR